MVTRSHRTRRSRLKHGANPKKLAVDDCLRRKGVIGQAASGGPLSDLEWPVAVAVLAGRSCPKSVRRDCTVDHLDVQVRSPHMVAYAAKTKELLANR